MEGFGWGVGKGRAERGSLGSRGTPGLRERTAYSREHVLHESELRRSVDDRHEEADEEDDDGDLEAQNVPDGGQNNEIDEEDADETELHSSSEESTSPVSKFIARTFSDKRGQSDRSRTYPRVVQAQRKPMMTVAVSPLRSKNRAYTEMLARGIVTAQEDKKKMKVARRYRP